MIGPITSPKLCFRSRDRACFIPKKSLTFIGMVLFNNYCRFDIAHLTKLWGQLLDNCTIIHPTFLYSVTQSSSLLYYRVVDTILWAVQYFLPMMGHLDLCIVLQIWAILDGWLGYLGYRVNISCLSTCPKFNYKAKIYHLLQSQD